MQQKLLLKELEKNCKSYRGLDLIGNKIADKITSIGKSKEKEKPKEKPEEIYIPPEKRQQIINDLKLFCIIMKLNIFYCYCHSHFHSHIKKTKG